MGKGEKQNTFIEAPNTENMSLLLLVSNISLEYATRRLIDLIGCPAFPVLK